MVAAMLPSAPPGVRAPLRPAAPRVFESATRPAELVAGRTSPHHREAIAMAREAKKAGLGQPELVELADDIILTQQLEIDDMLGWREEWFGSRKLGRSSAAGLGLDEDAMGMQHDPGGIAGEGDVDAAFAAAMIPHHEGAIAMAELARDRGEHPEIRELVESIISGQGREIEILRPHAGGRHGG
ncbi:MAG: DUF305 domain-containing protein [Actinomycetota bacterium]|nr:DUF305 domain-containing protein [Actinomycetota bacterium]